MSDSVSAFRAGEHSRDVDRSDPRRSGPIEAARYQIVVMLMITATAAIGSMMLVGLSFRRLFTGDDALKAELLTSVRD